MYSVLLLNNKSNSFIAYRQLLRIRKYLPDYSSDLPNTPYSLKVSYVASF